MRTLWITLLVACSAVACQSRPREDVRSSGGATGTGGAEATAGSGSGSPSGGRGNAGSSGGSAAGLGGSFGTGALGGESSSGGGAGGDGAGGADAGGAGGNTHPPQPCNSSDGSGCDDQQICIDVDSDACWSDGDTGCQGYCSAMQPSDTCEGGLADCTTTPTCATAPTGCPAGYSHSIVDSCWGPCVPLGCCACASQAQCPVADYDCDLVRGRCAQPLAPEPRCFIPFDAGESGGTTRVFAFIDGRCQERMASDAQTVGNDNRFEFLEECLWRCEGLPQDGDCPEGRVPKRICLACGGGGGCRKEALVCARSCEVAEECDPGMLCVDGVCGANFCI